MNREILFRAKRKDNNEWVYGYYSKTDLGTFINQYRVDYDDECTYCEDYEVIPETVCEYIGLKDKKGMKIFENDIVNGITGKPDGNSLIINNMEVTFDYMDLVMLEHTDNLEVIGNVFDKEVK